MAAEKYSYRGGENTGFYATVTNSYILVPPNFKMKEFFEVEVVETQISKTRLVGLFSAGNSNCLLVPRELSELERNRLEDSGINFKIIDSRYNALGNLILCNDQGALISEKLSDFEDEIEKALDVPVTFGSISGLNPGVCGVCNDKGAVIHRDADKEDAELVKNALKVEKVDIGTVSLGSPYMGSGALANSKHLMVSEETSGPEIGRLDTTLF